MTGCRTPQAWSPARRKGTGVWCPYRAADRRDDLDVFWEPLPASTGGGIYIRYGDGSGAIVLDPELDGPARRDALTHELIHHEREGGAPARLPIARVREEDVVRREVAARLVPTVELQRYCDAQADLGHGVAPEDVMAEWDVTWQVACDALDNLRRWECR